MAKKKYSQGMIEQVVKANKVYTAIGQGKRKTAWPCLCAAALTRVAVSEEREMYDMGWGGGIACVSPTSIVRVTYHEDKDCKQCPAWVKGKCEGPGGEWEPIRAFVNNGCKVEPCNECGCTKHSKKEIQAMARKKAKAWGEWIAKHK